MITKFYQQELSHLRDLAVEFSKTHPALAPMLAGASQDPDVERLLEGSAFLTGLLRQKLDDEFPEVVHGLVRLIFPHYLRPIPSTTIVAFTPKQGLMEAMTVPAGIELTSVPVEGTKVIFRTCYDVEVHPLRITEVKLEEQPGRLSTLTLQLELTGIKLATWHPRRLRFFLAGNYAEAASLYYVLFNYVRQVAIMPVSGGSSRYLGRDSLKPVGFANKESLFPYPSQSFTGYRALQEYFILPEKFLFFDVTGLETWTNRGPGNIFKLVFTMESPTLLLPQIKKEHFTLFATPAVNLFPHDADPITLDHRQPDYRVLPSGGKPGHYQVYLVESVTGFAPGTVQKREFAPFELFTHQTKNVPVYYVNQKVSAIRPAAEVYLSVAYPPQDGPPMPETLSIKLWCTNADLAENLKLGDISKPTSSSPELCEFKNILPPTFTVQPPLGRNLLWRLLSHLALNLLSLGDRDNLKTLLRLYIFPESRDRSSVLANEKRIDGIVDLKIRTVDRLFAGLPIRGQDIRLKLNPDHFASRGDMYLFGAVMDHFLGTYANINCFASFHLEDSLKGETYSWPVRMGDRPLI